MSRSYRRKPSSYYRMINIQAEFKDPELFLLGYSPRIRHQKHLSSWDDVPFSSYSKYNIRS